MKFVDDDDDDKATGFLVKSNVVEFFLLFQSVTALPTANAS